MHTLYIINYEKTLQIPEASRQDTFETSFSYSEDKRGENFVIHLSYYRSVFELNPIPSINSLPVLRSMAIFLLQTFQPSKSSKPPQYL